MKHPRTALPSAALLVALLTAACGGGGGGGGELVPTAEVSFPGGTSTTDASAMTVSGRSQAAGAPLAAVRVDGVPATSSDGFATWTATVPLGVGTNRLEVELEDADGDVFTRAARADVRRVDHLYRSLGALHVDPVRGVIWALDGLGDALIVLGLQSGAPELVSGDDRGAGPLFGQPRRTALSPDGKTAYVADFQLDGVVAVDVATGDREVLALTGDDLGTFFNGLDVDPVTEDLVFVSDRGVFVIDVAALTVTRLVPSGSSALGPALSDPRSTAVDPVRQAVYVATRFEIQIVDVKSGKHELVSGTGVGTGPEFAQLIGIAVDPVDGTIYGVDNLLNVLFSIDPVSGEREAVAPFKKPVRPGSIAFDPDRGLVLVVDTTTGDVLAIDPVKGTTGVLASLRVGEGAFYGRLDDFASSGGRLFAVDSSEGRLLELDGESGDRVEVSGFTQTDGEAGAGESFSTPAGVAVDLGAGVAYVADEGEERVVRVELASGDRSTVAQGGLPGTFATILRIELLPDGRLLVLDRHALSGGLWTVDPATGQQTPLSNFGDGKGVELLKSVEGLALDLPRGRALVTDSDADAGVSSVKAVDLATGQRSILSASVLVGGGEALSRARGIVAGSGSVAYVGDFEAKQILAVDLATGVRTLVSGATRGGGPELDSLQTLFLDRENGRLLTYSNAHDALLGVSLASGDRAILSK